MVDRLIYLHEIRTKKPLAFAFGGVAGVVGMKWWE
jgi:hypothetical protein